MPALDLTPLPAALFLPEVRAVCPVPRRDPETWTHLEVLADQVDTRRVSAGRPVEGLPKRRPLAPPVDLTVLARLEEEQAAGRV